MVKDYSERLKEAMADAEVDVAGFAKTLGVSYQALRKAINGGRLGMANHLKAAKLLGVNSDWLASGKGPKAAQAAGEGLPGEPSVGRRKGDFVQAITPAEQDLLDDLLDHFRQLLPSDRKAKLKELADLARIRAAERAEMLEEAGFGNIMKNAANATRGAGARSTVGTKLQVKKVHADAPELPDMPPPEPADDQ